MLVVMMVVVVAYPNFKVFRKKTQLQAAEAVLDARSCTCLTQVGKNANHASIQELRESNI
jgi:hypothetical protein